MSLELRVPMPPVPGVGVLRRGVNGVWRTASDTTSTLLAFAKAVPSLAISLERLADLQDELAALGALQDELAALGKMDFQLERLADLQDELATLGRLEGALAQIALFGTPLDKLTGPVQDLATAARTLPELSTAAQSLPELVDQVRQVEMIVAHMDERLDDLMPTLERLAKFGEAVEGDIDELSEALEPVGRLAARLPGGRRRKKDE